MPDDICPKCEIGHLDGHYCDNPACEWHRDFDPRHDDPNCP